jgi:hypothetical protein
MDFAEWAKKIRKWEKRLNEEMEMRRAGCPNYSADLHRSQHCGAVRYAYNSPGERENYIELAMRWAKGMAKSAGKDPRGQPPIKCIECYAENIIIEDFDCPLKKAVPDMLRVCTSLDLTSYACSLGIKPEDVGSKGEWVDLQQMW